MSLGMFHSLGGYLCPVYFFQKANAYFRTFKPLKNLACKTQNIFVAVEKIRTKNKYWYKSGINLSQLLIHSFEQTDLVVVVGMAYMRSYKKVI